MKCTGEVYKFSPNCRRPPHKELRKTRTPSRRAAILSGGMVMQRDEQIYISSTWTQWGILHTTPLTVGMV